MPDDAPRAPFETGDDIASVVGRVASETPDRLAIVRGTETRTWGELDAQTSRVARGLSGRGLRAGDRVAILASNSIEYAETFFGALRAGAAVVPLPTMTSSESLALMLADSDSRVLFADLAHRAAAEMACSGRRLLRIGFDFDDEGWTDLRDLQKDRAPLEFPVIGAETVFDVIYSSGTTGVPKGIVHDHGARKASYAGSRARYFSRDSVNLVATPFYSNTTCITWLLTTAAGGINVILGKFSPEAFFDAAARHRVTHTMLVPVQYERILAAPGFAGADLSNQTHFFCTSAPLRAQTKRRLLDETSAELVEIYGLTEGGPGTVLEARRHPDKLASVGLPPPGCEMRIIDDAGRDVPRGQTGEVVGRSASMMSGYLNRPDDTRSLHFVDANGRLYFRSGDLGRFDEDGFLYLLDRKKDVIISGGFNVYATDLEAVFAEHPAVSEVAVVGVPSERWGETPLAFVVVEPGSEVTAEGLRDYCNARVGKAQRVSAVIIRSDLPKSAIGKILKRELRQPS